MKNESSQPEAPSVAPQRGPTARVTISTLKFSGGEAISVSQNAVIVIVGPNNSGKSVALQNIAAGLSAGRGNYKVCTPEFMRFGDTSDLQLLLTPHAEPHDERQFRGPSFQLEKSNAMSLWQQLGGIGQLSGYFQILMDTNSRLNGCGPGQAHAVGRNRPNDAFQMLYEDPKIEAQISKIFREVFGTDLVVNQRGGGQIPLHVGERPALAQGEQLLDRSYVEKVLRLPPLIEQGDGMKSFAAVLLTVKVFPRQIILIDEPEAFLHPPQERRMGRLLSEAQPDGCQIIVSTHSEDIIQGLLSGKSDRVSVVRLVREGDINRAKQLDNEAIATLWKSPILRYSNILSGLFHEGVVISEGDGDCRFYESILNALPRNEMDIPDLFFTHSGGKDRIPTLVAALRALDVPVRAIADVDVLREEKSLRDIVTALGGNWSELRADWEATKNAVQERKNWFRAGDLLEQISGTLAPMAREAVVDKKTLEEIAKLCKQTSPWEEIKRNGIPGPLTGEGAKKAKTLLDNLSKVGLLVVPVGEVECFAKTIGGHGPRWVEKVLERDLSKDPELRGAREFVAKLVTSFGTASV